MSREVFFVGTIPLARTYEVLTVLADEIGERARRVPDGETGDRTLWVSSQYPVLASSGFLEVGDIPPGGVARKTSHEVPLRLKRGADTSAMAFHDLGYARHAITSYGVLRALKKAGRVPGSWRLQVNLPAAMDVLSLVDGEDRAVVEAPYEKALLAEVDAIQAGIPHDELAITVDAVRGILEWERPGNEYAKVWFANGKDGVVDRLVRMAERVAADVELGLHLCYGSQDHSHVFNPVDLSTCVDLANAIAGRLPRPVGYVHMPVPRDRDDAAYFAPLARLDGKRVKSTMLGLVHYSDGVEGARRRMAAASRHMADFGVATECGFGRRPRHQDILELIRLHRLVADAPAAG